MSSTQNFTLLLDQAAGGDRQAADDLFSVVYDELKRLAAVQMRSENPAMTLQTTGLVHEVWLRLIGGQDEPAWNNRRHFFGAASLAMRRILVDNAKARKRVKRGGGKAKFELRDDDLVSIPDDELLALDEALELLKAEDQTKANLVNLRYFAGFTNAQAAEQLGISAATAERYWTFAKAWLRAKIESEP